MRPSFSQILPVYSISPIFLPPFFEKKKLRECASPTPLPLHPLYCKQLTKRDKVSAHVPPASLSVLPAICYCLHDAVRECLRMCVCARTQWCLCVCLYHAFFILFFLCVRKAKVN